MNCDHARNLLDAHVDRELDDMTDAQVAQHLLSCSACSALRAERDQLRAELRRMPRHMAPAELRASVMAALSRSTPSVLPRIPRTLRWWQAATVSAACAGIAFALGVHIARPDAAPAGHDQIVARHVALLAQPHQWPGVASSDRHAVKPWFAGQIDFAPPVRDLAADGFVLTGGRLVEIDGRPAAAISYRIRNHVINLFVWRAADSGQAPVTSALVRGFALSRWSEGGLQFVSISDVDARDLERFTVAVRDTPTR